MDDALIEKRLMFLERAEGLKDVLRSGHTSTGRRESTAEHTWRLCLMVLAFADTIPDLDVERALCLCIVHDLAEIITGDIPAPAQRNPAEKADAESIAMHEVLATLDGDLATFIASIHDEYTQAQSLEALVVRAMDKFETIIQHNQGLNEANFDYGFNLAYGRDYSDRLPQLARIRALIDRKTLQRAIS